MTSTTTIQLEKSIVNELKKVKEYPEQTYNVLIRKMVKVFKNVKKQDQYDEFLHKIQQKKMHEIWGSKEDEVWDNV